MKKPWAKWCLLGMGALFALVGVPILINESYKVGVGYITIWNAADVLSYYGTVVGAVIAVATIAITITFNRKQIQRESYLKSENEKWKAIESEIADVLDRINPQRILMVGIDCLLVSKDKYSYIFSSTQKYQMDCRIGTDKLSALLSPEDYSRIEELLGQIRKNSYDFYEISGEQSEIYQKMFQINDRDDMRRVLEMEEKVHNSFSEEELKLCREVVEGTENLQMDDLRKSIGVLSQKFADAYTGPYRDLLSQKKKTFDTIYTEIQKNADEILHFGRK